MHAARIAVVIQPHADDEVTEQQRADCKACVMTFSALSADVYRAATRSVHSLRPFIMRARGSQNK